MPSCAPRHRERERNDDGARRLEDAYTHRLDEGCRLLAGIARRRGWKRTVLAGDRRLTRRLENSLAPRVATITSRANLHGLAQADVRERLLAQLARLISRQAVDVARTVVAAAEAGRNGVTGLPDTLAALASGRVEQLIIDPEATFRGTVGADESLTADQAGDDFTDWIVALALATDADVLPVTGEAANMLAHETGIGALLRW